MKNIFYKYNCSGNTFVVVKYDSKIDYTSLSKKICSKEEGVGANGLIVVKDDINEVLFYNQDGSNALFCGNGLRATLHYLKDQKGLFKRTIPILFNDEIYYGKVLGEAPFCSEIRVNKSQILLNVKTKDKTNLNFIKYKDNLLKIYPIKVGVFHIIILNETTLENKDFLNEEDLIKIKEMLKFKYDEEPNIDIVKLNILEKTIEEITFYERGVGYTKTCGSGSIGIGALLELMNFSMDQYIKITDDLFVVIKENVISLIGKSELVCVGKYSC